jgi:glutamate---cysteine ligase / carboxylate-amine ligase
MSAHDPDHDDGAPLGLFQGFGVELEYMIVSGDGLDVRPLAPQLLEAAGGGGMDDVERGEAAWSNELVAHVVEFKTNGPAPSLRGLAELFQGEVRAADALLAPFGARLLPGGMHPWMVPAKETQLYPGEYNEVYRTFDRIFDCRHHGWSNLQSTHLNLPFADDEQFARLHAAVRIALPILPALSASTPVMDGAPTGFLDNRLRVYRTNARRVPPVSGRVVPEPVWTRESYEREILGAVYDALAPHDPEGTLRHEWANSRGAIARFDRMAIEIRTLDIQECPLADIAVLTGVVALVRALCEGRICDQAFQRAADTERLASILWRVVDEGERAQIDDRRYLDLLGWRGQGSATAGELWSHLVDTLVPSDDPSRVALDTIVERGPLARRIVEALPPSPTRADLGEVWGELADCLRDGRLFRP